MQTIESLVIGFGNTLRGDDALGRIASEHLQAIVDPDRVKVISQCAPTPELAADIAQASRVIFLDASAEGPSDRIVTSQLKITEVVQPMSHRLDAAALIELTHQLYGRVPEAFAITFRGQSFEFRDQELSPNASVACDLLVRETLNLINNDRGYRSRREFSRSTSNERTSIDEKA